MPMEIEYSYHASTTPTPKRREPRLQAALDVRVLGIDAAGKPFHQAATTVDISLSGARISGLTAKLKSGDIVGLHSGTGKSRFQVVWITGNRDGSFVMGLYCVEKGNCPWRENLQPAVKPPGMDRRSSVRYPCQGSATVRSSSAKVSTFGTLRDISEHGCYVQSSDAYAVGEILSIQFAVHGIQIGALAQVSNSLESVGMGLRWCDLGVGGEERLHRILRQLMADGAVEDCGRSQALLKVEELHRSLDRVRERLGYEEVHASTALMETLREMQTKLAAALKELGA